MSCTIAAGYTIESSFHFIWIVMIGATPIWLVEMVRSNNALYVNPTDSVLPANTDRQAKGTSKSKGLVL